MRISDWSSDVCSSDLVRRADAAEQPIDQPQPRGCRGNVATRLREHDDQRVLAQEGRFAAHIGAGDEPEARLFRQPAIVGDEALAACRQRRLDHRMAATLDLEARVIDEIGARPAAFDRAFGEARGNVESGERSEEHTSELQSLMRISYAVFCLKKKNKKS